jgi:hypothetical protein
MKTASFLKAMLISWLMAGITLPVVAQVDESIQNLYKTAGKKQTNKDFKPAPDEIETSLGSLKFEMEAYPTEETVQKLYDELDLQRATQAYLDFYPALSVYAGVKGQIRDFGFKNSSDIGVAPGPGLTPANSI